MAEARLLVIIPARGGSKRVPRKNVRPLGGRPLIAWSVSSALEAALFCDVLVSTDDLEIATAARDAGALVPWLRPAELASDTAGTSDVLRHALAWYETEHGAVDAVVLLQPTCPLRRAGSLQGAVRMFLAQEVSQVQTVVSVSPAAAPPQWCFHLDESGQLAPILGWAAVHHRSQDLQPSFQLNGSIYIAPAATVRAGQALVGPGTRAFVMSGAEEAVDIDTEDDWRLAEFHMAERARECTLK